MCSLSHRPRSGGSATLGASMSARSCVTSSRRAGPCCRRRSIASRAQAATTCTTVRSRSCGARLRRRRARYASSARTRLSTPRASTGLPSSATRASCRSPRALAARSECLRPTCKGRSWLYTSPLGGAGRATDSRRGSPRLSITSARLRARISSLRSSKSVGTTTRPVLGTTSSVCARRGLRCRSTSASSRASCRSGTTWRRSPRSSCLRSMGPRRECSPTRGGRTSSSTSRRATAPALAQVSS
mmetsp:Transcript_5774/g.14792  ORF Transcript_5774/g.14792 Transcript_5774/m.14792 type:complete len:244 (-) Transcript_5774:204-935(-)